MLEWEKCNTQMLLCFSFHSFVLHTPTLGNSRFYLWCITMGCTLWCIPKRQKTLLGCTAAERDIGVPYLNPPGQWALYVSCTCGVYAVLYVSCTCGMYALLYVSCTCGMYAVLYVSCTCGMYALLYVSCTCGMYALLHVSCTCSIETVGCAHDMYSMTLHVIWLCDRRVNVNCELYACLLCLCLQDWTVVWTSTVLHVVYLALQKSYHIYGMKVVQFVHVYFNCIWYSCACFAWNGMCIFWCTYGASTVETMYSSCMIFLA